MHNSDPQAPKPTACDLFNAWKHGDDEAFVPLAAAVQSWLRGAARQAMMGFGINRAEQDSQDLSQQVWLMMLTKLRRLPYPPKSDGQLKALLKRLIRNDIVDRLRRQRGIRHYDSVFDSTNPLNEQSFGSRDATSPDERAEQSEARETLWFAINLLDDHHRHLIVAHEIEGQTFIELASELGATEDAVRMRFYEARAQLLIRMQRVRNGAFELPVQSNDDP